MNRRIAVFFIVIMFGVAGFAGFSPDKIKARVSEFTLGNGLKFILLEDHSAPIAHFVTYVDAGGSDEKIGIYGISHFLEHLAFKGTSVIGTRDSKAEQQVLKKMDAVFDRILAQQDSLNPDRELIKKYRDELERLSAEASRYVIDNDFDAIYRKHGAVNLNATTSMDATVYTVSLPANRIELWALMESARFSDPVFREFYKERAVIQEERRSVVENNPMGKLYEETLSLAFKYHPYRIIGIGSMNNIAHITRQDVMDYFRGHYTARNLVIGVAGDVTAGELKRLAKKYFSRLKPGRKTARVFTGESESAGEKTVTIYEESQPLLLLGYRIPSLLHADFIKFILLDHILTTSRSSRLNQRLVINDKSALGVGSMPGVPGSKYPGLYIIFTIPNMGHTNSELLSVIGQEIEKIGSLSVTEEELAAAKRKIKLRTLAEMKSTSGLLMTLLEAEVLAGSWQKAFDTLTEIEKIGPADIQALVKTYLVPGNRVVSRLEKKEEVTR